jgi:hypothetical protein
LTETGRDAGFGVEAGLFAARAGLAAGLFGAGAAFRTFVGFFAGLLADFFTALADFDVLLAAALDFAGALRAAGLAALPEGLRFRDVAIAAFLYVVALQTRPCGPSLGEPSQSVDSLGGRL